MKGEAISEYSLVEILRRFAPFAAALILLNPTNERYCNNVEDRHRYICEVILRFVGGSGPEHTLRQKSSEIDHPRYLIA
jgi:hypothetical protein